MQAIEASYGRLAEEISIGVNPARFVFVPHHGRITLRPDHLEWLLESSWYVAGDMAGIWHTNATMSQIAASLRLLPHAGASRCGRTSASNRRRLSLMDPFVMFLRRPQTSAFYSQNSELVVFRQGQGDAVLPKYSRR